MTDLRPASTARQRHVAPSTAVGLSYQIVLRQLASRGRIIGLSLLALVAPISGWALGSADSSLDDAVRLVASVVLGLVFPIVSLVIGGAELGDLREDKTLL
jgi:hypothetical protein